MSPMCGKARLLLVVGFACAAPQPGRAQLARVGGEFQINAYTPGVQRFSRVAGLPDGGFVVVWTSEGQDGDGFGLFGKRFGADGQAVSPEFPVNSTVIGDQWAARLALAPDGTFLVVWGTRPERTIMGRRFDMAANALTGEIRISDDAFRFVFSPDVAASEAGGYVVVWAFGDIAGDFIRGQALGADARPNASAFLISDPSGFRGDRQPAIASGQGSSSMAVWCTGFRGSVDGRVFEEPAQPMGQGFTVSDNVEFELAQPQICHHRDSGFVVVWQGRRGEFPNDTGVVNYRRYDDRGVAQTPELTVTADDGEPDEGSPTVACGRDRQTVIAWVELYGIRGRHFIQDPPFEFSEFRITSTSSRPHVDPSAAMVGPDSFVLTWTECAVVADDCDVFGQRFTLRGPTDCPGDCNRDGLVTVDELLKAINIALGSGQISMKDCLPADPDLNYSVSIDELVTAVGRALEGCP
jgi:hypothetical protein